MAVKGVLVNSTLGIKFKSGVDSNGKDVIKTKKLSNIKVTAAPDKLLEIGTAMRSLLTYEFVGVVRSDDSLIVNE